MWFGMWRDGLVPRIFSTVHPRFKTPHWSSWIAGAFVGIPAGIEAIGHAADLSNLGTLFAFVLVSLGALFLPPTQPHRPPPLPPPPPPPHPSSSSASSLVFT